MCNDIISSYHKIKHKTYQLNLVEFESLCTCLSYVHRKYLSSLFFLHDFISIELNIEHTFPTARLSYHHFCCITYLYRKFDPRFDSVANRYQECKKTTGNLRPSQRKVNVYASAGISYQIH